MIVGTDQEHNLLELELIQKRERSAERLGVGLAEPPLGFLLAKGGGEHLPGGVYAA